MGNLRAAIWTSLAIWALSLQIAKGQESAECCEVAEHPVTVMRLGTLPDAPSAVQSPTKPRFFAMRRWDEPALRNPFKSRTWVAAHLLFGGALASDAIITKLRAPNTHFPNGVPCAETNPGLPQHPTNGDLWRDSAVQFGAITAMDWLLARYVNLPLSLGPATYGTVKHAQGAYSWKNCR
jgi:hypothetical protein